MLRGRITAERLSGLLTSLRLSGTFTEAIAKIRSFVATSAGTSSAVAALVRLRLFLATAGGTSSAALGLARRRGLRLASAGVATTSAALKRLRKLLVASAGKSSVVAALVRARKLLVASAGTSTVANIVRRIRRLLTASNGTSTATLAPDKREALTIDSGAVLGGDGEPIIFVPGSGALLSAIGIASVVALSIRLISDSYVGPCMNVRRSLDNATQDIGFVNGNLDTAALLAFVGGGSGYVTTWYDQSGNGNHATQPTTSQQATIVSAGTLQTQNSKANLNFGPGYGGAGYPMMQLTTRLTNVRSASLLTYGGCFWLGDTNAGGTYDYHRGTPFTYDNGALIDQTRASVNVYNGTIKVDGVAKTYSDTPPVSLFALQFVTLGNTTVGLIGGGDRIYRSGGQHMGELILFTSALTTPQLSTIQSSQKAFFGTA